MNIRDMKRGTVVQTRYTRNGGGGIVYELNDNYWNHKTREAIRMYGDQAGRYDTIRSRDISLVLVDGDKWEPVELTPAQARDLKFTRQVEYNTSPDSEAYWAS